MTDEDSVNSVLLSLEVVGETETQINLKVLSEYLYGLSQQIGF